MVEKRSLLELALNCGTVIAQALDPELHIAMPFTFCAAAGDMQRGSEYFREV